MKATDTYSYRLVILSIMISRPFHTLIEDTGSLKQNNTILESSVQLIHQQDQSQDDFDLDVGIVRSLLKSTVRVHPDIET
jgi:hypothetical protein